MSIADREHTSQEKTSAPFAYAVEAAPGAPFVFTTWEKHAWQDPTKGDHNPLGVQTETTWEDFTKIFLAGEPGEKLQLGVVFGEFRGDRHASKADYVSSYGIPIDIDEKPIAEIEAALESLRGTGLRFMACLSHSALSKPKEGFARVHIVLDLLEPFTGSPAAYREHYPTIIHAVGFGALYDPAQGSAPHLLYSTYPSHKESEFRASVERYSQPEGKVLDLKALLNGTAPVSEPRIKAAKDVRSSEPANDNGPRTLAETAELYAKSPSRTWDRIVAGEKLIGRNEGLLAGASWARKYGGLSGEGLPAGEVAAIARTMIDETGDDPFLQEEVDRVLDQVEMYRKASAAADFAAEVAAKNSKDTEAPTDEAEYVPLGNIFTLADVWKERAPIDFMIPEMRIGRGMTTIFAGPAGALKSMTAQAVAVAALTGAGVLGFKPRDKRYNVLHLDFEQGERRTLDRYKKLFLGFGFDEVKLKEIGVDLNSLVCAVDPTQLDDDNAKNYYRDLIQEHKADLVILDTLRAAHKLDENKPEAARPIQMFAMLASKLHFGIIFIAHTKKVTDGSVKDVSGTSAFGTSIDYSFTFEGGYQKPTRISCAKGRDGGDFRPMAITTRDQTQDGPIYLVPTSSNVPPVSSQAQRIAIQAVLRAIVDHPEITSQRELQDYTGFGQEALACALKPLIKHELIVKVKDGEIVDVNGRRGGYAIHPDYSSEASLNAAVARLFGSANGDTPDCNLDAWSNLPPSS